eukprot:6627724-Lingulodinium_polyedra.AAC.1
MHCFEQAPCLPGLAFACQLGNGCDTLFEPMPSGTAGLVLDASQQGLPVPRSHGLVQPEAGYALLLGINGIAA